MHGVITRLLAGLGLATVTALTALGGTVAVYVAGEPGENLTPVGDSAALVEISQVSSSILWTSLSGNVSMVETLGWPSSDGIHDLGGGLTIERPSQPLAGAINTGEQPRSVEFRLGG